jgi:tetratricopeptide (TPR) repeat protein
MSGLEFRRRIRIAKGIYINLSKHGIGFSVGEKGIHYSTGPTGEHVSVGVPGTGLYFRRKIDEQKKKEGGQETAPQTRPARQEAVTQDTPIEVPAVGMLAPHFEKQFHRGCVAYQAGEYSEAYQEFEGLVEEGDDGVGDARFMAALCAGYTGNNSRAIDLLSQLLSTEGAFPGDDGTLTAHYLPGVTVRVPITQFAFVELHLSAALAMFLVAELLRAEDRYDEAIAMLEDVVSEVPDFRYGHLALADLYCLTERYDQLFQLLSEHEHHLENEDDIALELMYYWAIALTMKEMYEAADDVYHRALAKSKDRNQQLVEIVQYGHADMYERWGKKAEARKQFEKLYAYDPQFYDVAMRVGALQEHTN